MFVSVLILYICFRCLYTDQMSIFASVPLLYIYDEFM